MHDFEVVSNREIADGIFSLVISAPKLASALKPGQFVNIAVPGDASSLLRVPLSFYRADAEAGTVELWYAVVGDDTRRLSQMGPGSTSNLLGPGGRGWMVPEGTRKALLVAGGIGVPPVLCLAGMLAEQGVDVDVCLGFGTASKAVGVDEFRALGATVNVCTDDGSLGTHGFCTDPAAELLGEGGYDYVASCGPAVMMKKVAAAAAEAGVYCEVSLERMMSCGFGACNTCNVETVDGMKGACMCGPVFDASKVVVGTVNMAVDFGGVKMQNPINTAAGTFGYGWQFQNFFDVSQLGAITTKGCAAEPWSGNPAPRMAEIPGGMINSVGLQNPGVAAFARESGPWLEQLSKDGCQVICQVAGHSVDEFVRALEMYVELCPWAAGYEINVSCPNIAAGGAAMGSTPEGASSVMAACRKVTDKPLFVKMAPVNVAEIAKALEAAGADGLSVINSIQGMAIDVHTRKSRVAKPKGGLSGPLCHHIAVRMVWEVAQAVDIPINGVGGVMTGEDAAEFILAGATCVSVGMANFVDPCASLKIAHELEAWVESQGVKDINELVGAFEC